MLRPQINMCDCSFQLTYPTKLPNRDLYKWRHEIVHLKRQIVVGKDLDEVKAIFGSYRTLLSRVATECTLNKDLKFKGDWMRVRIISHQITIPLGQVVYDIKTYSENEIDRFFQGSTAEIKKRALHRAVLQESKNDRSPALF